jgi:hypothetical protein
MGVTGMLFAVREMSYSHKGLNFLPGRILI